MELDGLDSESIYRYSCIGIHLASIMENCVSWQRDIVKAKLLF